MIRKKAWLLSAGALATVLLGCSQNSQDNLLTEYRSHAETALTETETFLKGDLQSSSSARFLDQMDGHLGEMRTLRKTMQDRCVRDDGCPTNGGMPGESNGGGMHMSRHMDADQMGRMIENESTIASDCAAMKRNCIDEAPRSELCRKDLAEKVADTLTDMIDFCNQMMNGTSDAGNAMGPNMMDGGRM